MSTSKSTLTEGFVTSEEVATALGVSEVWVRRWVRKDKIPAVRLGRLWLIPTDALKRAVDREPEGLTVTERAQNER